MSKQHGGRTFHMIARPIICVGSSLNAWNALNRIDMNIYRMCMRVGQIHQVRTDGRGPHDSSAGEGAG